MSFGIQGVSWIGEERCSYGESRLFCRGPEQNVEPPYFAFLGDNETFGRFVRHPFAAMVEKSTGHICVNLGCTNAGLDAFLQDEDILQIAAGAEVAVFQVMRPQNQSNKYYRVHPRRNDRFLLPTREMIRLYPEVDFTQFSFNNHLLLTLQDLSPVKFNSIVAELKRLWLEQMTTLVDRMPHPPVLLWLRYDGGKLPGAQSRLESTLVEDAMVEMLRPKLRKVVEIQVEPAGIAGEMNAMEYGPMQAPMASHMIGQATHYEIAETLVEVMPVLRQQKRPA